MNQVDYYKMYLKKIEVELFNEIIEDDSKMGFGATIPQRAIQIFNLMKKNGNKGVYKLTASYKLLESDLIDTYKLNKATVWKLFNYIVNKDGMSWDLFEIAREEGFYEYVK